jgi:hypothetical protein
LRDRGRETNTVLSPTTAELLRHFATRPGHDEVKADFRDLLRTEFGVALSDVDLERRVLDVRGRLDALIGRTVFEAKSNLDNEWADVERRMPDYLVDRERESGERFVGIASDGLKWIVLELSAGTLVRIKETILDPERGEAFLAWLDGAMALKSSLPPEPLTIRMELGGDSVAFIRASSDLAALWAKLKDDPAVALKRQLWASLLRLVYGRDIHGDALWVQHTFLVIVAKCIALAVLDLKEDNPARVLSGRAFQSANISGAVESDFFDWVMADPEGERLVRRIMAHVRRFRLREVESDVLKILYESLIDREERHGLGEYYTPDWLAAKIVRKAVERPTEQKVLDPACGSGTFLFHAVRRFLAEAEEVNMPTAVRAAEATGLVAGMDIHPVAVIIARVTYLLALAPALAGRAGTISIPVYLGDSMQLSITQFHGARELSVRVPPPGGAGRSGEPNGRIAETLDFPETFCREPALFDKAIERMRAGSEEGASREQIEAALKRIVEQHFKRDANDEEKYAIGDLGKTYLVFDQLRRDGRDSVWAYVARNLSRPLFFAASGGWANIVIGNPPWVSYRHMSGDLQKRFKALAKDANVYVGGRFATQNDLSALFTARSAALYLRPGGVLAFVLPLAALTRGQFEKFRSGTFGATSLAFQETWTMDDTVQPLFPVPSSVVFARRRRIGQERPKIVRRAYSGTLPYRDAPEDIADRRLTVTEGIEPTKGIFEGGSPYRSAFRQGATLVPRFLCLVERKGLGRLGADAAAPFVASRRSSQEKEPWKSLPGIEGRVERDFLRPVLLGESILPYRVWRSFEGVIPVTGKGAILDANVAARQGLSGLHEWMTQAEAIWKDHGVGGSMTLPERWNYHNELGAQFPLAALRVVYAKAGTLPAACIIRDRKTVVDHKLYWTQSVSEGQGGYLAAILNSETARVRVASLQSRGQWGARDFDKVIFSLPIPRFDAAAGLHQELAATAADAENLATAVDLPDKVGFVRARKLIRNALAQGGISERIDACGAIARRLMKTRWRSPLPAVTG